MGAHGRNGDDGCGGKLGQKALQHKLAMQGEPISGYFAEIGRQGGLAKARKRYQPYEAWQQDLA